MTGTRTDSQKIASISNGKLSQGPVTAAGKAVSAMNGVHHGLAASSVLLPSETRTDYEKNIEAWVATLHPASPGEAESVARVADLNFRLRRLQRLEDKHVTDSIELKLSDAVSSKSLALAGNVDLGLSVMVATVAQVTSDCSGERAAQLLPAIRAVFEMAQPLDLPITQMDALNAAYRRMVEESATGSVGPEIFAEVAAAGRELQAQVATKIGELRQEIDRERERVADGLLLGDDKELKRFERHRARLNKALDAELVRIKLVRELAGDRSGSSVSPVLIELKVLGGRQ